MTLAATAEGRIPAETVIRDARLVNVSPRGGSPWWGMALTASGRTPG